MLGNIGRIFPWDVADDFDMITMRSHDDLETSLMFVPGHMAFFRHTPAVLDSLLTYPVFASFAAFKAGPWFGEIADEAEWSHFLLTSPRLTWLVLPGLVDARVRFHHGPSRGVFELRDEWFWDGHSAHTLLPSTPDTRAALLAALRAVAPDTRPPPTFSNTGSEYAVALEPGAGAYVGDIWFDPAYALHANMDAARYRADLGFGQRFFLRRTPGGPVLDRQEPARKIALLPPTPPNPNILPNLLEGFYSHFQAEKYADWWDMPPTALARGHTLVTDHERGAEVWDEAGNVVFSAMLPADRRAAGTERV